MYKEQLLAFFAVLKALGFDALTWLRKAARSRTMWFASALTIFGVVEANMGLFQTLLGDHYGLFATVIGITVGLLRIVTVEPLSAKVVEPTE